MYTKQVFENADELLRAMRRIRVNGVDDPQTTGTLVFYDNGTFALIGTQDEAKDTITRAQIIDAMAMMAALPVIAWKNSENNREDHPMQITDERLAELIVQFERAVKDQRASAVRPKDGLSAFMELQQARQTLASHEADIEILMNAMDRLAYPTTIGPAILTHLGEAAENEIRLRASIASNAREHTATWKRDEAALAHTPAEEKR